MSLATIMLDQLAVARRIVEDGEEMTPAWRIETTEGAFLILTRFDTDKNSQERGSRPMMPPSSNHFSDGDSK